MSTRRRTTGRFAMIPAEVMDSEAFRSAPHYAIRVLLLLAVQFSGKNNGDIALTWQTAQGWGFMSKAQLNDALRLLLERGLIVKTRQGGRRPIGPCLYALGWRPIDIIEGKPEITPTGTAPDEWRQWRSAPPAGHGEEIPWHHRRGSSAPPAGHENTASAPPAGHEPRNNGTTGSAPLISEAFQGLPVAVRCGRVVRLEPVEVQQ